jgi:hypothetical protein
VRFVIEYCDAAATMTTTPIRRSPMAFVFDLDGTLVDSVYQHVLAWREALRKRRDKVGGRR